jgi:plastocyanin
MIKRVPLLSLLVLALAPAAAQADQSVRIADACGPLPFLFCFTPASVAAASGEQVTWSNQSITPIGHTVTRCTPAACQGNGGGSGADVWTGSGTLFDGNSYSHTFTGAGTYIFYCMIHGYAQMHGTITVAAGSQPPPPASPPPEPVVSKVKLSKSTRHREAVGFTLSLAANVTVVVKRGGTEVVRKTIAGHAGQNSFVFNTAHLHPGSYAVTVTPAGGKAKRAKFRL